MTQWEAIGRAHGDAFRDIRPAATMVEVRRLIDPELAPTVGFDQESKYHGLTADEHIFETVQALADQGAPLTVRWAGLLHDSGKPEAAWMGPDGRMHYYKRPGSELPGHEAIGAQKAESALDRFAHLQRDDRDRVIAIVRNHMFSDHDKPTGLKARRFLAKHGEPLALDLLDMKHGDVTGKESDQDERLGEELGKLDRFRAAVQGQLKAGAALRIRDLAITGHDLLALGYPEGPPLGQTLEHLRQQVVTNPSLNTPVWLRAEAARRLRKLKVAEAYVETLHPRTRLGRWRAKFGVGKGRKLFHDPVEVHGRLETEGRADLPHGSKIEPTRFEHEGYDVFEPGGYFPSHAKTAAKAVALASKFERGDVGMPRVHEELLEKIAEAMDDPSVPLMSTETGGDLIGKTAIEIQDKDGPPDVVADEEFDKLVKAGKIREFWRGLDREHAEQFATGDLFVWPGNYGSGVYVASHPDAAAAYARGSGGVVMRIGVPVGRT
jgi:tRNA nucleotidyltransferase (CCA-adding enzyme)